MRTSRFLLPLLALALAACAPELTAPPDGPEPGQARIEVVGASDVAVDAGGELELTFRYVGADGAAVPGGLVDFAIEGAAAGATLGAMSGSTDGEGLATVIVRAADEAVFGVTASAGTAVPATVNVTVRPMVFGTLAVQVTYMGERSVRQTELGLFLNARCDDLRTAVPAPTATAAGAVGGTTLFGDLPLEVPMAVYALGIDAADQVAAEGCLDVTLRGERQDEHLGLRDVDVALGGPYATVERFDVTDGFPSGLDTVLEVAAGLSSPDPARWLVDRVAADPSAPSWLRTALGSSFTRGIVADLLGDALDGIHAPSELVAVGRFGADVDSAFGG